MKILFIAPLPPPLTGHSLAAKVLLDELVKHNRVEVVDFKKEVFKQGVSSLNRIVQIFKIHTKIWLKKKDADVIYLTISQSIAGNIKDLIIYAICFKMISRMIIHLHGGGIRKLIFDRYRIFYHLNKFFLKRIGAAVVLGKSLISIFEVMIPQDRIYVIPNFAEDYLLLDKKKIKKKFFNINPLRILFLSNLIPGKGYEELIDSYVTLNDELKKIIRIDFAGGFESEVHKQKFLDKIKDISELHYHGIVSDGKKKELFSNSHLFCLPTYYDYEGQPISILEAYASGCVVITTDHGGVSDIFKNGVNGFEVRKKSAVSIMRKIEHIQRQPGLLLPMALSNRDILYEKYRTSTYCSSLLKIFEDILKSNLNMNAIPRKSHG
jgi:glycosyltransferase involved in cell wall biosynthesis